MIVIRSIIVCLENQNISRLINTVEMESRLEFLSIWDKSQANIAIKLPSHYK